MGEAKESLVLSYAEYKEISAFLYKKSIELAHLKNRSHVYAKCFVALELGWHASLRICEISPLQPQHITYYPETDVMCIRLPHYKGKAKEDKAGRMKVCNARRLERIVGDFVKRFNVAGDEYIFAQYASNKKKTLSRVGAEKLMKKMFSQAGITRHWLNWHGIRRGRANYLIEEDESKEDVRLQLRHAHLKTTNCYIKKHSGETWRAPDFQCDRKKEAIESGYICSTA